MIQVIRIYASTLLVVGCLLFNGSARAIELGSCESERGKLVFILKHVFKPFTHDKTELTEMRQELVDLSVSLDGWVEDIDDCYRTVFQQYRAPVNNPVLNDGLDWSSEMTDLKRHIEDSIEYIKSSPEDNAFWEELDNVLRAKLPQIFAPNGPYQAMQTGGNLI